VRPAPLAIASIVGTFTLSSGAAPFNVPHAGPHSISAGPPSSKHAPTARAATTMGPSALRFGRSIGSPTEGRLVGGMHIDESSCVRVVPAYAAGDARWGLEPLVTMIDRAARALRRRFPDAILSVGQLSRAGGGDIDRHRSHESGRDADISFFVRTATGRQLLPSHFVAFQGDGTAVGWPGAYFDDSKNWALVAAMVTDAEAHVTHLFIAAPLRARLLAYAERTGVPASLRMRAAEAMQQPHGALPHDDHFHVRVGCPPRMVSCVENPKMNANRMPPPFAPYGRRGGPAEGLSRSVPKRPLIVAPAKPSSVEPPGHSSPDETDPTMPPASMPAPVDDVDG
jgi:penicillin-insensitive murein endopeptidase